MTDTEVQPVTDTPEPKKKREGPRIPPEQLEDVYEMWVAHPDRYDAVPIRKHHEQANAGGWWFSGRRGIGPTLEPLPADLAKLLAARDESWETRKGSSDAE